jgi:O-succinylbenzoic acid--CoA ligase
MGHTLTRVSGRAVRLLPVPPGPDALSVRPDLERALAGSGPALLPVAPDDARLAGPAPNPLAAVEDDPADPTALVVFTSGSTGDPKGALLPASALRASAAATYERLGGPGSWLLALPPHHIAGLQVLLRSLLAGTSPRIMDLRNGFSPNGFLATTEELTSETEGRRYVSLVPTQLTRLLGAGPDAVEALASYDAVLVGGAATAPDVVERALAAGVAVVTTYGMSETCGGCVYDGRPLPGVWWRTEEDGRVELGGPVVARGYVGRPDDPAFTVDPDGSRWFRTDDIGEADLDGTLTILGRLDDVIVTGGLKVSPGLVEAAIGTEPGIREVVVVGAPDSDWGERVVAVVVAEPVGTDGRAAPPPQLAALHRRVAELVASYAVPRQLLLVDEIPLIGPGKPDRSALRALAARTAATDQVAGQ